MKSAISACFGYQPARDRRSGGEAKIRQWPGSRPRVAGLRRSFDVVAGQIDFDRAGLHRQGQLQGDPPGQAMNGGYGGDMALVGGDQLQVVWAH